MRSIIYYAASTLRRDELQKIKELNGPALFKVFPPEELASVLAATYLYRRLRKVCDPRIWESLCQEIQIQMETGFHVGSKLPAVGTAHGLLLGVVRYSALGLFSVRDGRNFRLFRRELNDKEKLFDLAREQELWGCNHLQIAAVIFQSMGLGVAAANSLTATQVPDGSDAEGKKALTWYATRLWIQSLLEEEKPPACFEKGSPFYLEGEPLTLLQERVDSIYELGSTFDWIDKTKEDLPKELYDRIGKGIPEPNEEEKAQAAAAAEEEANAEII